MAGENKYTPKEFADALIIKNKNVFKRAKSIPKQDKDALTAYFEKRRGEKSEIVGAVASITGDMVYLVRSVSRGGCKISSLCKVSMEYPDGVAEMYWHYREKETDMVINFVLGVL